MDSGCLSQAKYTKQISFAVLHRRRYRTNISLDYHGLPKPPVLGSGSRDMLHMGKVLFANPVSALHSDLGCSPVASDLLVPPDAGRPRTSILPMREASSIL